MAAVFAWFHQSATRFLSLIVTPSSPSLSLPVSNGQVVAALQGAWSDSSPFTGSFIFVSPNFDHGGDYAISGSNLVVNNAANLNAIGVVTVEHVTLEAVQ